MKEETIRKMRYFKDEVKKVKRKIEEQEAKRQRDLINYSNELIDNIWDEIVTTYIKSKAENMHNDKIRIEVKVINTKMENYKITTSDIESFMEIQRKKYFLDQTITNFIFHKQDKAQDYVMLNIDYEREAVNIYPIDLRYVKEQLESDSIKVEEKKDKSKIILKISIERKVLDEIISGYSKTKK